jgi:hypothetical protein
MEGGFSFDVSPAKLAPIPAMRLGDLTPRKLHYQTAPADTVNCLRKADKPRRLTAPPLMAAVPGSAVDQLVARLDISAAPVRRSIVSPS